MASSTPRSIGYTLRERTVLLPELLATAPEITEELAPSEEDLWRAAALDLREMTRTVRLGIVAGLHRCYHATDGTVLACAGPDAPSEHAAWMGRLALEAGTDLDVAEVECRCPAWTLLPDRLQSVNRTAAGIHG